MRDKKRHVHSARASGYAAQSGVVLLLALLIMSSVIVAASGMGALILNSLQQTRILDNSVVAYYAAESAIEEGLFRLRRDGDLPNAVSTPQALSNGAEWTREIRSSERVIYMTIPKDSFAEIALYDPDAPIAATDIAKVKVWWNDDCGGCSVLHTTLVGWLPQAISGFESTTYRYTWNDGNPTATIPVGGLPQQLFRLRLRADGGTMEDVVIRAVGRDGDPVDLPGRVKIDARGHFVNTQQRITVTMPRQVPLSGVYDFVVFSECSLVKGGPISCP